MKTRLKFLHAACAIWGICFFANDIALAQIRNANQSSLHSQAALVSVVNQQIRADDVTKLCFDSAFRIAYANTFYGNYKPCGVSTPSINPDSLRQTLKPESIPFSEPWAYSLYPMENVREFVLKKKSYIYLLTNLKTFADVRRFLEHQSAALTFHYPGPQPTLDELEHSASDGKFGQQASWAKRSALCADVGVLDALSCSKALGDMIGWMNPKQIQGMFGGFLPIVPVVKEVLSEEYAEGLRIASLKVLDRMRDPNIEPGNLFDDVKQGFIKSGIPEQKATDMAWNVMGVLAGEGASSEGLLGIKTGKESDHSKIALAVLGMGSLVLDAKMSSSHRLYSYPSEIKTTCDMSKPYHFWMAAYLARRAVKSGHSVDAAQAAAFSAQKGYEMISATAGRQPDRPFWSGAWEEHSNIARIDMAFSSAGAVYGANGANQNKSPALDVDEGIRIAFSSSRPIKQLTCKAAENIWTKHPIKAALSWEKLMAPNAAFKFYQRSVPEN